MNLRIKQFCFIGILFFILSHYQAFGLEYRQPGMKMLGVGGGYGFAQASFFEKDKTNLPISGGSDALFGLRFGYYINNNISLNLGVGYNRYQVSFDSNDENLDLFTQRSLAFDFSSRYLFMGFLYLGGGLFLNIPVENIRINNTIISSQSSLINGGALVDFGGDLHFTSFLSLLLGLRLHFPFYYLTKEPEYPYTSMNFSVNFLFELGWTF